MLGQMCLALCKSQDVRRETEICRHAKRGVSDCGCLKKGQVHAKPNHRPRQLLSKYMHMLKQKPNHSQVNALAAPTYRAAGAHFSVLYIELAASLKALQGVLASL